MVHTPTLLYVNILITTTLAACLGLVARRDRADGLMYWALALVAHTGAYVLYALRGVASDWLSVVLANVLITSVFALMSEGVYKFQGRRPPRRWIWAPVPFVALTFALLQDHMVARVLLLAAVLSVQFVQFAWAMHQRWALTPGRGKQFVLAGFGLFLLALLVRAAAVLSGTVEIRSVTDSNAVQALIFSITSVAMVLSNFGMVVMTKERADERNRQLAMQDELTGLSNRRDIQEALTRQLAQALRSGRPLALLMIDIDHFKRINDSYGHLSGDQALRQLADCIRARVRSQDLAGRWGGEEFLVVLPETDAQGAALLAEHLRLTVERTTFLALDGPRMPLTVSIGCHALDITADRSTDDMVNVADQALYRAKQNGRNRVEQL
jgi:diguanylate cyclase (GGDEF)-like protein